MQYTYYMPMVDVGRERAKNESTIIITVWGEAEKVVVKKKYNNRNRNKPQFAGVYIHVIYCSGTAISIL